MPARRPLAGCGRNALPWRPAPAPAAGLASASHGQISGVTNTFNFSASPFDCLSTGQQQLLRRHLRLDTVPAGEVLLAPGEAPSHLFVLVRGHVQQWDGDELVASYGPDDCFDGRALVAGKASHRFVTAQALRVWRLDRQAVGELIAANATFGALLFADLSQKLNALAERHGRHELQ